MKTHSLQQTNSDTERSVGNNQASTGTILQAYSKTAQLQQPEEEPIQQKENKTGLPDNLKSGVENLSGQSLDDVKVHYNSSQPASVMAHAYAQGTDIHLGPGQEKHLPHEAWHIVQQKEGRVKPTVQTNGVNINDNVGLEKEADVMGGKAEKVEPVQRVVNGSVVGSTSAYPQSIKHIDDVTGGEETYHIAREEAKSNRRESLRGVPTKPGLDRDEFPMAMFSEGGAGADIEYIDPSDNRGAGSWIGAKLRSFASGTAVVFKTLGTGVLQLRPFKKLFS